MSKKQFRFTEAQKESGKDNLIQIAEYLLTKVGRNLEASNQEIKVLKAENNHLRMVADNVLNAMTENQRLTAENERLTNETNRLNSDIGDEVSDLINEVNGLMAERRQLTAEVENLRRADIATAIKTHDLELDYDGHPDGWRFMKWLGHAWFVYTVGDNKEVGIYQGDDLGRALAALIGEQP